MQQQEAERWSTQWRERRDVQQQQPEQPQPQPQPEQQKQQQEPPEQLPNDR